jgi:hypothetical protein
MKSVAGIADLLSSIQLQELHHLARNQLQPGLARAHLDPVQQLEQQAALLAR